MLCLNQEIIIAKAEKGNGVVVIDSKMYQEAILKTINDKSRFKDLKENPTIARELKL